MTEDEIMVEFESSFPPEWAEMDGEGRYSLREVQYAWTSFLSGAQMAIKKMGEKR